MGDIKKDVPIWGIALGGSWRTGSAGGFRPRNNLKLDWGQVFAKVDSLTYTIDASDNVNLDMKLNCSTPADAATLRQVLDGLKMAQQLSWSAQNPGHPNPYTAHECGCA